MPRRLSELERAFAEAYLGEARGNATDAARLAGYKGSRKTLERQGCMVLKRDRVVAYLDELRAETKAAGVATRTEVLELLTRIMRGEELEQKVTPLGQVVDVGPTMTEKRRAAVDMAKIQGWVETSAPPDGIPTLVVVVNADGQALEKAVRTAPKKGPTLVLPDNGRRQVREPDAVEA